MKTILTIFQKEMRETLRDRRTLLTMIVIPFLLLPLIFSVSTSLQSAQSENARMNPLRVAITDNDQGAELRKRIQRRRDIQLYEQEEGADYRTLIREDSLDLALDISPDFDHQVANGQTGALTLYFNSTNDSLHYRSFVKTITAYHQEVLAQRLDQLGARTATITPTKIIAKDVYTRSESLGKMIGGFLPYIFVLFCLIGAMYPAIDLFTGEKERGTIETILSVPVDRLQILLGKMGVVVISGVISGLLTILGMYLALQLNPTIPVVIKDIVGSILSPQSIGLVILMLFPLTIFFAGLLIPAAIYSRSFKEAQSLIQPMLFVLIIPLLAAMSPGIRLTVLTALVPVLNIALATREIVAGTIDFSLLGLVFASLLGFAAIAIMVCVKWFGKEGNILRI